MILLSDKFTRFSTFKDQVPAQNFTNLTQRFVDMSIMNKCAKFYGDTPSSKQAQLNLARAIELSDMGDFVYNLV